ncbi:MAG: type II secretion system F family protein, partial [Syntrophorhabdus sp.]
QRMDDLSSMVKRALMYPVFALVTTGGALGFWVFYVLPKIMAVMRDMNVKLPLITRIILGISDFTKAYWYMLILVPVMLFVMLVIMKRKEQTRYLLDLVKLKVPILKLFVVNRIFAVFCEQMRILVISGITIDRSLVIAADAVGSEVFRRSLIKARDAIMTGSRISDAFRRGKFFHPLVVRMVDIGETSGNLDNQFNFLATFFYKKLADVTDKLGKMIEPILLVLVGCVFAIIILGLLLPIYDIVTHIGK